MKYLDTLLRNMGRPVTAKDLEKPKALAARYTPAPRPQSEATDNPSPNTAEPTDDPTPEPTTAQEIQGLPVYDRKDITRLRRIATERKVADAKARAEKLDKLGKVETALSEKIDKLVLQIEASQQNRDVATEQKLLRKAKPLNKQLGQLRTVMEMVEKDPECNPDMRKSLDPEANKTRMRVRQALTAAEEQFEANGMPQFAKHLKESIPAAVGQQFIYAPDPELNWAFMESPDPFEPIASRFTRGIPDFAMGDSSGPKEDIT